MKWRFFASYSCRCGGSPLSAIPKIRSGWRFMNVMDYTRSLGQSGIVDNALRGRARRIKLGPPSARLFVAQRGERIDLGCAASGDVAGQHRNTSQ